MKRLGLSLLALSCTETTTLPGFPQAFAGVGVELTKQDPFFRVVMVIAGGPAEQAGIVAGDLVRAIDEQDVAPLSLGDVVHRLRGTENTLVVLRIQKQGGPPQDIEVTRRKMRRSGEDYGVE